VSFESSASAFRVIRGHHSWDSYLRRGRGTPASLATRSPRGWGCIIRSGFAGRPLVRTQEVAGSSPASSMRNRRKSAVFFMEESAWQHPGARSTRWTQAALDAQKPRAIATAGRHRLEQIVGGTRV
jgi:hypothetical protein